MQPAFDFGEFPVLATTRLSLCELEAKYAADVFVVRGDPEVQLYNSVPLQTLDETLAFIEQEREAYRLRREVIWGMKLRTSQRMIGGVSLFDWDRYHRGAKIGYDLARDCWGMGFAQEAIREVLRFGFERMALHRIEIWTSAANQRSLRLAERLGFTCDGMLRKRILEDDGQFYDCAVYGLLIGENALSAGEAP
ncbi:MAG TPA: GNAT family N-acetyltransferase [Polyangiaceae bacterium]|jgi:ribosomal-protein-alanine N-acetyltransferase